MQPTGFPAGDHDDQIDAAAGAFAWSLKAPPFAAPSVMRRPFDASRYGVHFHAPDGWRRMWRDRQRRSG